MSQAKINPIGAFAITAFCGLLLDCSAPQTESPSANNVAQQESVSHQCLLAPIQACTDSSPCSNDTETFTSPSSEPACAPDGGALSFKDGQGTSRYFCRFKPSSSSSLKPLIIWLHGGTGSADNVYSFTDLRNKAAASGFILASLQSRNLHVQLARLNEGHHFDTWWWDLKAPSTNPDIDALDRLIDTLVKEGQVDPKKIYVMGWSEGGMLAQLYGLARHETPSTYGHKVAALAAYSASSPFHRKYENNSSCAPDILLKSSLPIFTISRSCDVVPCNKKQETDLWNKGSFADVINMDDWRNTLLGPIADVNISHVLLNKDGSRANACAASCTLQDATINHLTWPISQENEMLTYLFSH